MLITVTSGALPLRRPHPFRALPTFVRARSLRPSDLRPTLPLDFSAATHCPPRHHRIEDIGGINARPAINAGTRIESNNIGAHLRLPDLQGA
jgi:hypothetical protein